MSQATTRPFLGPSLSDLRAAYRDGSATPEAVVERTLDRITERASDHAWITVAPREQLLERAKALTAEAEQAGGSEHLPLFGVPVGVKDNLDVAGLPTTNGCPSFASTPLTSATAVQRLERAGGIVVGKTNLDQFATGLVGSRSPYGRGESVYGQGIISGGSSSGSALAVAQGVVPVAVATDTAGSGRVPAALNGIIGIKPTRGLISTVGLVPACRTLDCITVMGTRLDDALSLLAAICGPDPANPWDRPGPVLTARGTPARPRIGLPSLGSLEFFGDGSMAAAHLAARSRAVQALGGDGVEMDLAPFTAAGDLLYEGPWVAERTAEFGAFIDERPGAVLPVIEQIINSGIRFSAVDAYQALYRLQDLRHHVTQLWKDLDAVLVPTVGTTFTFAEVDSDPLRRNAMLGRYTQFGNLLDLAGIAIPLGVTQDDRPVGITLLGPAGSDLALAGMAARLLGEPDAPSPALTAALIAAGALAPNAAPGDGETVIAVAGRHLSSGNRNADLLALGGRLVRTVRTAPAYRLFRLPPVEDPLPALVPGGRASVEVELWAVPTERLGALLVGVPAPLSLGRLHLEDGRDVLGFVADAQAVESAAVRGEAMDISASGGWRQHLADPSTHQRLPGAAMNTAAQTTIDADPYPFALDLGRTALVLIDMQRDFVEPGGFGETLGNDVSQLAGVIPVLAAVLAAARSAGMLVIHTREGHLPDLSDCPPAKLARGKPSARIGDPGPNGRILIRGERGHDIIDDLYPIDGEPVVDKPGKGAFYATEFGHLLAENGINRLIVTGVTTEVCVHTTVREANDRGFECLVLSDCVGSYFPEFQRIGLQMVAAQGGIFGWVAPASSFLSAVRSLAPATALPTT